MEADRSAMSPAEFLMVTEAMGWSRADTCRILSVADRTLRYWMAEPGRFPEGVGWEIERAEDFTASQVDQLVARLRSMDAPAVEIYRSDEELWAARPDMEPWPARWWRVVAYQACLEVAETPVEITWAND